MEEREKRKGRGKRYEEFEKEWLATKPPEEALKFYGSWPDGAAVAPVIRI
jgi:acetophenone carboxylase